jgi:hypothetical protein
LLARFSLYEEGYHTQIDSDLHAKLCEDTLDDLWRFFGGSHYDFGESHNRLQNVADSIGDIMSAVVPSPYSVINDYEALLFNLKKLKEDIITYESDHLSNDFINFDNMMSALQQFIAEYQAMDNNSVDAYLAGSLQNSLAFQALGKALQDSFTDRQALSEDLQAAGQHAQERFELLKDEWAKEREEQGWLNLLVGGLVVVGGVFCIVATAGLATPLVVAGAVAGMATIAYGASNMVEAGYDIYYGYMGDYSTAAFNPLRDTVFEWAFGVEGKQQAFDTFGTAAIITSTVLTLGAGAISAGSAATQAGTSVGRAVGVYGGKVGLGIVGGYAGSFVGKETATYFGASETVSEIFGVLGGATGGVIAGMGAEKLDSRYNISGLQTQKITDPNNLKPGGGPQDANYYDAKTNPYGEARGSGFTLDNDGNPIKDPCSPIKGQQLDRYGDPNGRYVSPVGENGPESFGARSLPHAENPYARHQYEVIRNFDELPNNIVAQTGKAAPAFGQPGGATQIELPLRVNQLIKLGFLKDVTPVNFFQTTPGIITTQNSVTQIVN